MKVPSASWMMAVLWYSPAARRSKREATMTIFNSAASCAHEVARRAGDGFGEVEVGVVLRLAEILRGEEFRQADDVRTLGGGGADFVGGAGAVFGRVRAATHLDERDAAFRVGGHGANQTPETAARKAENAARCVKFSSHIFPGRARG